MSFAGIGCLLLLSSGIGDSGPSSLPTWYLIERKLFSIRDGQLVDDMNVWRELDRRLINNRLSSSDAERIVADFEQGIRERTKRSKTQFFSMGSALRTMASRGMVSDERLVSFGEAYYGKPPTTPLRLRRSENPISLSIDYGHIGVDRQHPTKLLWVATRVQLDGEDAQFSSGGGSLAATIDQQLKVGEHEVRIELDCALVMHDSVTAFGGSIPVSQWPEKLLKRWTEEVVIPLTIYPVDVDIIALTSNPELNPEAFVDFSISTIRMGKPQRDWLLHVDFKKDLPVAISGDLFVTIGGERLRGATLVRHKDSLESPRSAYVTGWALNPKSVKAKTATIEFIPNPKPLERNTDVTEIWGETILFENVSINVR